MDKIKNMIENEIKNCYRKITMDLLEDISEKYNISLILLVNNWNKVNKDYSVYTENKVKDENINIVKESWMIKIPEEELDEIILEE